MVYRVTFEKISQTMYLVLYNLLFFYFFKFKVSSYKMSSCICTIHCQRFINMHINQCTYVRTKCIPALPGYSTKLTDAKHNKQIILLIQH